MGATSTYYVDKDEESLLLETIVEMDLEYAKGIVEDSQEETPPSKIITESARGKKFSELKYETLNYLLFGSTQANATNKTLACAYILVMLSSDEAAHRLISNEKLLKLVMTKKKRMNDGN